MWSYIIETSWRRPTKTLLDVSFETSLRHREDVLIIRCCYILFRRCHDNRLSCHWDVPRKCLISDVPATLLRHTEWCSWNVVTTFSCQVEDASKYLRQKVMIMTLVIFWFSYFWLILLKSIYNPYLHFHYNRQLVKLVIRININC